MAKTPTWQRKAGQNPKGGLNEAGRRSLKAAGHDIKRPQPEGGSRRDSFCARMKGMKAKLTSAETANDPDSRINKSLRAWNCADGGAIRPELGGGGDALKAAMKLINSPSFKKWFGQSKAVDEAGNPLRLFHGTRGDFSQFDPNKASSEGGAFYFSRDAYAKPEFGASNAATYASGIGGNIMPVHLKMENPLITGFTEELPKTATEKEVAEWIANQEKFDKQFDDDRYKANYFREAMRRAKQKGNDSVIIKNVTDDQYHTPIFSMPSDIYSVFDPTQIKSAIGNIGTFDPHNPDIRRSSGGSVRPEMGAGGNALKAAVKMAQDIIKAYHGSPHKFDKFDINKIGTGEGAQAYGHGLYFAENPAVAQEYRDKLSSNYGPRFTYEGKDFGRGDYGKEFYKHLISSGVPQNDALAAYIAINEGRGMQSKALDRLDQFNQDYEPTHAAREIIKKIQPTPPAGHMYEVAIHAKPEHLLDWDKPFNQQTSAVKDRLANVPGILAGNKFEQASNDYTKAYDAYMSRPSNISPQELAKLEEDVQNSYANMQLHKGMEGSSGSRIYNMLSKDQPWSAGAEKLKQYDIPGIKYLDQVSRGTGEGSSNYVVFDPKIIDIMRRYAHGGRIHFDEGGLARIEELLRQAKGEEQATQASHPVGMSGNVEFAPVEIDEPLTWSKIPLGSLPAPTAAVVNPVANILAQYGPYAMGPIPAGMAAARDLATGIKEGSGLDVATAAMGAPGKMAKYGLPALGAVTDLLSPTEAQAGAGSKLVKGLSGIALRRPELFRAEHPYFPEGFRDKMAGIVSPFSKDEDIAKAAVEMAQKYRTPLENKSNLVGSYYGTVQSTDPLSVMRNVTDIPGISLQPKTAQQSYEDLYKIGKGGTLINLAGDRSDFGRLTHIGGRELEFPVDLHAGPKYMLEPNPGEIWANAPEHAGKLQKKVAAAEKKGPVIGMYTPMGAQSVSSSQHMFDALMAQMKGSGASKEDMRAFDEMLRKGEHFGNNKNKKKAVEYMKGWPGLENAREAAEFAKGLPGHHRAAIVNEMEKARWKKLGFPEVGVTRVAVTDPDVLSTAQNLIGGRATTLSTKNPRGADPLFQHSTYGSPTYGEYLMELPFVQRQYAMPEAIKKYTEPTKTGTVVHPFSEQNLGRGSFRKLFETNFLTQPINQQWLDTIMTGLERQKQYGFNKGGKAV